MPCCCGSTQGSKLLTTRERRFHLGDETFSLTRCTACGLVRTEPQPSEISRYYPAGVYYAHSLPRQPTPRAIARAARASARSPLRPIRERLSPGVPTGPIGSILDVGCGSGEMLLLLKQLGWDCHGIDPSRDAFEQARRAGLDVQLGTIADADYPDGSFDVVRFWHSLEHSTDPLADLCRARRLLKPKGRLIVGVPNLASVASRWAGERSFTLDVPRHLWHFEPKTLDALAYRAGFHPHRQVRFRSTSSSLLGTIDNVMGLRERLLRSRTTWFAMLPAVVLLDLLRLGDGLELRAIAP